MTVLGIGMAVNMVNGLAFIIKEAGSYGTVILYNTIHNTMAYLHTFFRPYVNCTSRDNCTVVLLVNRCRCVDSHRFHGNMLLLVIKKCEQIITFQMYQTQTINVLFVSREQF